MLIIEETSIKLTRGDTAYINIPIKDNVSGEEYQIQPTDTLTMSCKKDYNATTYTFQKTVIGTNNITITHDDTKNAEFGKYVYDVRLKTAAGEVFTVIPPSTLELTKEVTIDD